MQLPAVSRVQTELWCVLNTTRPGLPRRKLQHWSKSYWAAMSDGLEHCSFHSNVQLNVAPVAVSAALYQTAAKCAAEQMYAN